MNRDELSFNIRRLNFRSRRLVESLLAGKYLSVFKGPGLEFDRVREYEYGDDTRFVDWNVSSRMNSLYSKTFREERELILMILVDVSPSIYSGIQNLGKRETAGMIFFLLALTAGENNDRVGSIMFSDDVERLFPPMKGRRHVLSQVSEVLGHQTRGRGSNLALALKTVGQTLKRPSIVFIISDFRCTDYQHDLALIARRHDVIAVRVLDRTDKEFPPVGLVELQDPESGQSIEIFGRSRTFQHYYTEFRDDLKRDWLDICRRVGVDTLEVDAGKDITGSLEAFFRRRRKFL